MIHTEELTQRHHLDIEILKRDIVDNKDTLKRIEEMIKELVKKQAADDDITDAKLNDLIGRVKVLEYKSGVWGFLGGALVVALSMLVAYLKG